MAALLEFLLGWGTATPGAVQPRPTYTVEVAWTGRQTGVFTIGVSTIGGPDTIGGTYGHNTFDSVTADVMQIEMTRGRSDDLGMMLAGECTLTLHDATGKYSPENAASPLAGTLVPLRPVRVRATQGATYDLFNGFITDITSNPNYGTRQATIHARDLFVWLDQDGAKPVITATGPTTTGAAIGLVLDSIAWVDPTKRRLDTGDRIPNFSADGTQPALSVIQKLLETERGIFYISAAGVATYEDRAARNRGARTQPQSTLAGTMQSVAPGVHLQTIKNRATVTRTGGVPQTYTDDPSRCAYGYRDVPPITSVYLLDDARALGLARWQVGQRKDAVSTARTMELSGDDPTALAALLQRDLNDRVTISDALTGISADFHIERIVQKIQAPGYHTGSWNVSKRSVQPLVIGVSVIGGPDVLAY